MKKYIFLFLTGLFISLNTFSQSVGITDFMRLNPYSNLSNPAHFIPYNGYVGIPAAANINFSLYNSGFKYDNLFNLDKNLITPNKFVKSLHSTNNWFNTNLDLEILGFGFRVKKYFFSFGYRLKVEEVFKYNKDLFGFILQGNLAKDGNGNYLYTATSPAALAVSPNLNIYQELSIGFQGQITDRLYIGLRPKMLFGIVNVKTDKLGANLHTNPDDYTISGNYDVNMNVASVIPFYKKDANGNIMLDTDGLYNIGEDWRGLVKSVFSKNLGFAIDLGAVYRINQQIRVGAAVTDLGFIRWQGAGSVLNIAGSKDFTFTGLTSDQITNLVQNGLNINLDTIFNMINNNFAFNEPKAYNTMLTSKIMADLYFDVTPSNRFILQFKGYIMGKAFLPQFTVAYNGSFFRVFDIVVSYSMMKQSFANLGVGLGIRIGPIHLYAGTDNILAVTNILNSAKVNATAGLLINFPIKKVKEPELRSMFNKKEDSDEEEQAVAKEPKVKEAKEPKELKEPKEPKVKEPKQEKEPKVKEPKPEKEPKVKEPKQEKEPKVKEPKPEKEPKVKEPKPEKEPKQPKEKN